MKPKTIVGIVLLVFAVAALVYVSIGGGAVPEVPDSGVVVIYVHGSERCDACNTIERLAHEVVTDRFADAVDGGRLHWLTINRDKPGGGKFVKKYGLTQNMVVVVRRSDGEDAGWEKLAKVWDYYPDPARYKEYVTAAIERVIEKSAASPNGDAPTPEKVVR